jgi:hypothetical protein
MPLILPTLRFPNSLLSSNIQTIAVFIDVHDCTIACFQLSPNNFVGQSIANLLGDEPVEWSCSEPWVVTTFC